ncbi:MAG: spore cortex biosynthesis protein YabQ [Oscillospiraceae bacterium]|jgi:hypothetical protein|nr:spore cortex biosynthesis protein YabQ [Oscillospiraceae bacterium]
MVYLPTIASQTKLFLLSLGFGFALGMLYDLFRILRLLIGGKKRSLLVQDILYSLCCTGLSFFFFLTAAQGVLRGFGVAGEILGWLIYYFSFGSVALRVSGWLVRTLHGMFHVLLRCVLAPFGWLLRGYRALFSKLRRFGGKKSRKFKKNLHFYLKKTGVMVYNRCDKSAGSKKESQSLNENAQQLDPRFGEN